MEVIPDNRMEVPAFLQAERAAELGAVFVDVFRQGARWEFCGGHGFLVQGYASECTLGGGMRDPLAQFQ